jgi:serine/threonine-protein kinase RIO1
LPSSSSRGGLSAAAASGCSGQSQRPLGRPLRGNIRTSHPGQDNGAGGGAGESRDKEDNAREGDLEESGDAADDAACALALRPFLRAIGGAEAAVRLYARAGAGGGARAVASGANGVVLLAASLADCLRDYGRLAEASLLAARTAAEQPEGPSSSGRREAAAAWFAAMWAGHMLEPAASLAASAASGDGAAAAVKIQLVTSLAGLRRAVEEDRVHRRMCVSARLARHVPRLCAGFTVCTTAAAADVRLPAACARALPGGLAFRVTVMEYLGGYITLDAFARARPRQPARLRVYVALRRLLLELWSLAGYAHGDLHAGNVMVHPETLDVKLLDFGFATALQPQTVRGCAEALRRLTDGGEHGALRRAYAECERGVRADAATLGRQYAWYHLDTHMLRAARLWVRDGRFKLLAVALPAGGEEGPAPAWYDQETAQQRNAPDVDVFFNRPSGCAPAGWDRTERSGPLAPAPAPSGDRDRLKTTT